MTFRGTYTALITPFRDGAVDWTSLDALVERQIEAGIEGLVPCGTTGESPTLAEDEQIEIIARVARRAAARTQVVAGVGSNSTHHAVELSRRAADVGATALMHVSPYYNRPTQEGLLRHFTQCAAATPLPVLLYNIPGRTGVTIENVTLARLADEVGNIVAVKHATGRVDDAADLMQECTMAVLSGDDPITLPLMSLGAVGVVSVLSNLAPRAVRRVVNAALAGDYGSALAAHRATHALARGLLSMATNPIPIKTALALQGRCAEEFRLPMCPMPGESRGRLADLLRACESSLLRDEPA